MPTEVSASDPDWWWMRLHSRGVHKTQNRIQDPAKLRLLIVDLMDQEQWMTLDADVKGDLYQGLLQKNFLIAAHE